LLVEVLNQLILQATVAALPASAYEAMECERISWDMLVNSPVPLLQVQPAESWVRFSRYMHFTYVISARQGNPQPALPDQPGSNEDEAREKGSFVKTRVPDIARTDIDKSTLSMQKRSRSRACILYSGFYTSLVTLPPDVMTQRDAKSLEGLLFSQQGLRLPVYAFESMSRISCNTGEAVADKTINEKVFSNEEAAWYSIHVKVVPMKVAFQLPGSTSERLPKDKLVAMLHPLQVDESKHTTEDEGSGDDEDQEGTTTLLKLNELWDAKYSRVLNLKNSWIPFAAKDFTADDVHVIPSRSHAEEEGMLPSTRIVLVRDLLKRCGKVSNEENMTGMFVLYSGRSNLRSMDKRWLEGIVISTQTNNRKMMCEVLYINGWVMWHDKSLFSARRSSNLRCFWNYEEMLEARDNPGTAGSSLVDWLLGTGLYDHYIGSSFAGSQEQRADKRRGLARLFKRKYGI
jgi:hypothetical protein